MDCFKFSVDAHDFRQPETIKPSLSALALLISFFEVVDVAAEDQPFVFLPDPACNADPPLQKNALRGPPLC
jgi:hypothetical protein